MSTSVLAALFWTKETHWCWINWQTLFSVWYWHRFFLNFTSNQNTDLISQIKHNYWDFFYETSLKALRGIFKVDTPYFYMIQNFTKNTSRLKFQYIKRKHKIFHIYWAFYFTSNLQLYVYKIHIDCNKGYIKYKLLTMFINLAFINPAFIGTWCWHWLHHIINTKQNKDMLKNSSNRIPMITQ